MAFSLCCVNSDVWLLLNAYQPQTLNFKAFLNERAVTKRILFCLQRFAFQGKLSTFALLNGKWNAVSFLSMAPVS